MDWTLKTEAGVEIAQVLNFTPALERTKIETRLYDGSYNVQTIGAVGFKPTATLLVDSMDKLRAVNAAEAECAVLTLRYRDTDYVGYISGQPSWSPVIRGSVYTAAVKFMVTV